MTPDEFRSLGAALYGGAYGWQTAIAERLGVIPRTVRRWVEGITPVPADVARILSPGLSGKLPRDEWITGTGTGGGRDRRYLVHTRYPRFVARVVSINEDGRPVTAERAADLRTGVVHSDQWGLAGTMLCEIIWIDMPQADDPSMRVLLGAAMDALAAIVGDDHPSATTPV